MTREPVNAGPVPSRDAAHTLNFAPAQIAVANLVNLTHARMLSNRLALIRFSIEGAVGNPKCETSRGV